MKILLGSQKGGCGKSTLATNLAAALAHSADVVLIDADSQGTSALWSQEREETDLPPVACVQKTGNIKQTVNDLGQRYDHVIIDADGRDSSILRTALLAADIVLCPFRPSTADVDTADHVADRTREAKEYNENLQVFAVLTMCPTNPMIREIHEATEVLSGVEGLPVIGIHIHDRKVYRDAMSAGHGVVECPNQKAATEIRRLIQAIGIETGQSQWPLKSEA